MFENLRHEKVYHRFALGDEVFRVKRVVATHVLDEQRPFVASGPYKVCGIEIYIRSNAHVRRYDLAGGGGSAEEEDLFLDQESAIAEAFLRTDAAGRSDD